MNPNNIILQVKVQAIYYRTDQDDLGISYATSEKRITISESENILLDRDIHYKEVLKVKYEYIKMEIPLYDLESYLVN